AAGSLLVVGLAGTELTGLERAWLRLLRPGGVILFRRNIADARQTRTLLDEATKLCAAHSFRCVDVEGGTVDRLRDALAPMPSAQAVARAAALRGNQAMARQHGELIGRGARAFGFNTTLAPVLDLALPESAAVIGTRAVARDAEGVARYARAMLDGLRSQGVAGCGKHFPGLGAGSLDSHVETPRILRTWNELWREDLVPYRALSETLPMVMVNHAAYPQTPGRERPASVSAFWMTTVLRKRIGFAGIIFSDDLEMGGILKYMPIEDAVVEAVRAGMDTMEICHSPELILRGYEALVREGERSAAFRRMLLTRARTVGRKRAKLFEARTSAALSEKQLAALRERVLRFGDQVRQLAIEEHGLTPKPRKHVEAT
ncbi:MAG: beta-N-acetylhexosaminidase, partial [Acidobacteriota bacterium]|nr:beta-N-acetylhexosaminidase [Acidobacteriota bacterium]